MEKRNEKDRLLQLLRQKNDWVTSKELSELMDCSIRHVRYLVSSLNKDGEAVLSSDKGYHYNPAFSYSAVNSDVPASATEREQYIIEKIVIRNKTLDIDELIDQLCVSDTTFRSELNSIRKKLSDHRIYLKTKNNKIFAVAKDSDRSAFSMSMIKSELKNNSFSLENTQRFFNNVKLKDIRQIVLGVLSKHEYYLDDYSLMTYIIHLALCIENHKVGDGDTSDYYKDLISANSDDVIIQIISEVFEELSKYYKGTTFTREDIFEASMLMTTRIINRSSKDEKQSLESIVGKETADLILKIVQDVNRVYSIDLDNEKFLYRFAIHVKNAIIRARSDISISEGQFIDLQEGYPFMYLIARYIAYKIDKETHIKLSDNEIAYIVLHIGAIIEEATSQKEKLSCIVLAPDYYVIGKNLCNRITQSLGDILIISQLITDYDKLKYELNGIDMVISTFDINFDELPVLRIAPFPSGKDLEQLRNDVFSQKEQKNRNEFLNKISRFTNKDLLYLDTDFKDYSEAIDVLCADLYKKGLVLKDFKEELMEHEQIAYSSYNNIAIAHSLNNKDIASFIAFALNRTPIRWGDNDVELVLIVSLKEEDRKQFREIFQFFSKAILNESFMKELRKVRDYDGFMQVIYNNN